MPAGGVRNRVTRITAALAVSAAALAVAVGTGGHRVAASVLPSISNPHVGHAAVQPVPAATTTAKAPMFAFYYLWWSKAHWQSTLGSHYPYSSTPLPLPARLDATGCHPVSNYSGNTLTDVR